MNHARSQSVVGFKPTLEAGKDFFARHGRAQAKINIQHCLSLILKPKHRTSVANVDYVV
jgi:hypothetical protein